MKKKTIIHVDMDAFYAAVEVRDNPELKGKPLIIGAMPHERGVVSTCSYEARKFGVRSAMSIKEAYKLCPDGIYMYPNMDKYKAASDIFHKIWLYYTDIIEFISLDEGFMDVTGTQDFFGGAMKIAKLIKERTLKDTGLTCSVGIGYSMMSAKLASEEKKPDGLFEIPDAESLKALIMDRNVRIIYGVGIKTAGQLQSAGINTVRDLLDKKQTVIAMFGNSGKHLIELAEGIDNREVTPYYESEAKSLGREQTFQEDTTDTDYLKDILRLIAKDLSLQIRLDGIYAKTVTLKVKYSNMKQITRAKTGDPVSKSKEIYNVAAKLLESKEMRPIRLIGISLSNFTDSDQRQLTLDDMANLKKNEKKGELDKTMLELQKKYGGSIIKTGDEMLAEKRFETD